MNEMTAKDRFVEIFNKPKFKEVHIEVMIENPYVFVLRTKEKNVVVNWDEEENNIVIAKGDRYNTRITVVPTKEVRNIRIKTYADNEYDVWFEMSGLTYNLFVRI